MGHKRPLTILSGQRPLSGVYRTFDLSKSRYLTVRFRPQADIQYLRCQST